jgi:hypothetical protein
MVIRRAQDADTPERGHVRAALRVMATRLVTIHRALIGEATATWAITTGAPPPGPLELFRLLREDPAFAWLQPMTRAIVDLDELAASDFDMASALSASDRVAALLDDGGPEFSASYQTVLQRDLEIATAHGELRGVLKSVRKVLRGVEGSG